MRISIACFLLAACGPGGPPPSPDSPPPVSGCQTFGPFQRAGKVGRAGGLPISPTGIESDPSVLRDGGKLKMWFTTANPTAPANLRSVYAESDDGQVWSNFVDSEITPTAGTFDGNGVETVSVVRAGNEYVAYYTGDEPPEGSNRFAIGRAVSPDGITWTKDAMPALAPQLSWEQPFCENDACTNKVGGTLEPSVLVEGTTYKMWYAALGAIGELPSFRIGFATSSDGITWLRHPDPVFTAGAPGTWDEVLVSHSHVVADPGGGYHLFYFGSSLADDQACNAAGGCLLTPGGIGHAFSSDGITWTRDPANPVVDHDEAFTAWSVGGPSALIEDGKLELWYFGEPAAASIDLRIGRATADCL